MTKRRRSSRVLALCAVLQMAIGVQGSVGFTLCLAEDGHVNLELGHGERPCTSEVRRRHPEVSPLDDYALAHRRCVDVPMMEQAWRQATDARRFPLPSTAMLIRPVREVANARRALLARAEHRLPREPTMRLLQTIVILA